MSSIRAIQGPALFYCRTPLQALIVERLVKDYVRGESYVIYHATSPSSKHDAYFARLSVTRKHLVRTVGAQISDTLGEIATAFRFPSWAKKVQFSSIFVSSFATIAFGCLAKVHVRSELYTFDDGTFNISPIVFSRWLSPPPPMRRLAIHSIGGSLPLDVWRRSRAHFTIYPPHLVVGEPPVLIPLPLFSMPKVVEGQKKVLVMLGSWYRDETSQRVHDRMVASPRIDLFLPHPVDQRSARCAPWLSEIVDSESLKNLIAEEVVLALLEKGLQPTVFGWDSSSLYNLAPYVKTVSLLQPDSRPSVPSDVASSLGVRQIVCRRGSAVDIPPRALQLSQRR